VKARGPVSEPEEGVGEEGDASGLEVGTEEEPKIVSKTESTTPWERGAAGRGAVAAAAAATCGNFAAVSVSIVAFRDAAIVALTRDEPGTRATLGGAEVEEAVEEAVGGCGGGGVAAEAAGDVVGRGLVGFAVDAADAADAVTGFPAGFLTGIISFWIDDVGVGTDALEAAVDVLALVAAALAAVGGAAGDGAAALEAAVAVRTAVDGAAVDGAAALEAAVVVLAAVDGTAALEAAVAVLAAVDEAAVDEAAVDGAAVSVAVGIKTAELEAVAAKSVASLTMPLKSSSSLLNLLISGPKNSSASSC